jgi:HlyD family secretion protein
VTRTSYYRVTLTVPPQELAMIEGGEVIPGMPIEAFLQTGNRSVLSYLTRPLLDQFRHAFRDG